MPELVREREQFVCAEVAGKSKCFGDPIQTKTKKATMLNPSNSFDKGRNMNSFGVPSPLLPQKTSF